MLTCCRATARKLSYILIWAVFSSSAGFASDRPLVSLESGMNDLIYTLSRSVVTVQNVRHIGSAAFSNPSSETVQNLIASGVVCDTFGRILTTAAVVAQNDNLTVSFENNQVPADLIAIDYFNDLALLQPRQKVGQPANLSDKRVCAGQMVVAVGHAFGLRASPVIGFCAGVRGDGTQLFTVPVSPSSIGGGVFDLGGRLLGIMTGTLGAGTGVAVAVPAFSVPTTISYLLNHGDRQAGYIGISTADIEITPGIELQRPLNLAPLGQQVSASVVDRGVIVTYLAEASPAGSAGLMRGDVIVGYNGTRVTTALDLSRAVRLTRPGTAAEVGFIRTNRYQTTTVLVGRKTLSSPVSETNQFEAPEPTADSLTKVLQYLKQEVSRLETRLKRAR